MTAPLATYNFDEASGDVLDCSGNGRHFSLNANLARTVSGHTNGGVTKSGAGFPVLASPSFVGTGAWTVMFWRQGLGDTPWWVRLYNIAADTGSGIVLLGGGTSLNVRIRTPGGSNVQAGVAPPGDGAYHHYAVTYDGTVGRLYIDAVLATTTASAPAPTAAVDRIDLCEHTLSNAFTDDLRFYDVALGQPEIATLKDTPVVAGGAPSFSGEIVLGASAATGLSGIRESVGAINLGATASIDVSGVKAAAGEVPLPASATVVLSGSSARAGSVVLSANASISAHKTTAGADPAPPERTFVVPAESRMLIVPTESRTVQA